MVDTDTSYSGSIGYSHVDGNMDTNDIIHNTPCAGQCSPEKCTRECRDHTCTGEYPAHTCAGIAVMSYGEAQTIKSDDVDSGTGDCEASELSPGGVKVEIHVSHSDDDCDGGDGGDSDDDASDVHNGNLRMPSPALRATPRVFKTVADEPEDEEVRRIRQKAAQKAAQRAAQKPPDGGWGWVVVGGSFIAFFLGGGLSRSFTLIYQHMLVVFGQSAAATSATAALFGAVKMCSSPIVSALCTRYSKRVIAVLGGVITAVAMVMTSFPVSLPYIYVTYGFMAAFGMNMILTPVFIIISEYFRKRRARAMSLAMLGASFGGIGMPPLITFLFSSFNYAGAMLIVAGLMFHLCLAGAVFRPVQYSKARTPAPEPAEDDDGIGEDDELPESDDEDLPGPDDDGVSWHRNSTQGHDDEGGGVLRIRLTDEQYRQILPGRSQSLMLKLSVSGSGSAEIRSQSFSHTYRYPSSLKLHLDANRNNSVRVIRAPSLRNNSAFDNSVCDNSACDNTARDSMGHVSTLETTSSSDVPDYPEGLGPKYLPHYRRLARMARRQVSFQVGQVPDAGDSSSDIFMEVDLQAAASHSGPCMRRCQTVLDHFGAHLFRQPRFVAYSLLMMCSILSLSISGTFLAGLVDDLGYDSTYTGFMLSVSAIGAIPSKSISGIVFDLKGARPHRSLLLSVLGFLTGMFAVAMGLCSGYIELFVVYVVYSFFASSYHCHQSTVLADIVRTRDVSRAMGLCRLFQGFGFIIGPTFGGFIRDRTGHYKDTFLFSGAVLAGFTLLYTLMELCMKQQQKLLRKRTIPKGYVARCRADSIWSNI